MKPLTDLLAKLKGYQDVVTNSCGEVMAQRLGSRYSEASDEIEALHSSVSQLSTQLDDCLALWERYSAGAESLSSELSGLEEQTRTHFRLQATYEEKQQQVVSAQVSCPLLLLVGYLLGISTLRFEILT